jgi:hypothetical protein
MKIYFEKPFAEESKLKDNLNIIKLILPELVGNIKNFRFLKKFLYGS